MEYLNICSDTVCFNRLYHFKILKDCIPQILLGPFLNKFQISEESKTACKKEEFTKK